MGKQRRKSKKRKAAVHNSRNMASQNKKQSRIYPFSLIPKIFIHPAAAGREFVENGFAGASLLVILVSALCSGAFYYAIVRSMDIAVHTLIAGLNSMASGVISELTDSLYLVFVDHGAGLIEGIPFIGDQLYDYLDTLLKTILLEAETGVQQRLDSFFQSLSDAVHAPKGEAFLFGFLGSIVIAVLCILLLMLFCRISKHPWHGFKKTLSLTSIHMQGGILFVIAAALLSIASPAAGLIVCTAGLLWRAIWLNSMLIIGADERSRNRTMIFSPILFLILLAVSAVILCLILAGSMYTVIMQVIAAIG